MSDTEERTTPAGVFCRPVVGSMLTVLSAIFLLVLGILLPLVGRCGARVPYARLNFLTFLAVLLLSLALAVLAWWSKLQRQIYDQSPYPLWSLLIAVLNVMLLAALLTGLLRI